MATKIERDTAKAMLVKLQAKLDALYEEQESMKPQEMKCGGKVKKMGPGGLASNMAALMNVGSSKKGLLEAGQSLIGGMMGTPGGIFGMNLDFVNQNMGNALQGNMSPDINSAGFSPFIDQIRGGLYNTFNTKEGRKNLGYGLANAAPIGYNLLQGMQEPEQMRAADFYNPMAGQALGRMAKNRYRPEQQLRELDRSYATGSRNVSNAAGGNRNLYMANQAGLMDTNQMNKAKVYDTTNRANMGQQNILANAELGVGQGMAQTNWNVDIANAQNRAARRNYLGQAAGDVSRLAQTNRLMNNQMTRDEQMLPLLKEMFGNVSQFMPWLQNYQVNTNLG